MAVIWIERVVDGNGVPDGEFKVAGDGTARFRFRKAVRAAGGALEDCVEGSYIVDLDTDSNGREQTVVINDIEAFRRSLTERDGIETHAAGRR